MSDQPAPINCVLIASGKFHDIDFARLELLKVLGENDRIRTRVFEDYSHDEAIKSADFLISYTCDVIPTAPQQKVLRDFIEQGGKWYALHGTSSILRFLEDGRVDAPRLAPHFMETLGSMFIAHPPIAPYEVNVVQPSHPLTKGIENFETNDELYLLETYADLDVLMDCGFEGKAEGFVEDIWPKGRHPVFYIHTIGEGQVLYLTLGHCRGHYDMQPVMDYYPDIERGAWDLPVFYELLRRGITWAAEAPDASD